MASLARHDNPYTDMRDLKWTPAEKAIARKAFDLALSWEVDAVIREAKDRAASIKQPSELWDLEHYLTQRRKDIDRLFDFRYNVLPAVFWKPDSRWAPCRTRTARPWGRQARPIETAPA
jgi:hypothetical protein